MINIHDLVKVQRKFNISIEDIDSLMYVYRPVIGIDTIKIYLCLVYSKNKGFNLVDILKENDLECFEFNRYKQALEEVCLLNTFEATDSADYKFILYLQKPDPFKILKNNVFFNKLKERVDHETLSEILTKYDISNSIPDGYKDVSSVTKLINDRKNIEFNNYEPRVNNSYYVPSIVYDIKTILNDQNIRNSSLYPIISTNTAIENITKILEIAGISPEVFRSKVLINFLGDTIIDFDKMKLACLNCKETMNYDTKKGYLNPCAVFLKKLYGFEPEFYDKRLADMIYNKYEFRIDVINYILEYCINNNDKKLNSNYLSRVCSTVKLKNINNLELLKSHLQVKKGVEFKRVEDSDKTSVSIDKKAIDAELADILNQR